MSEMNVQQAVQRLDQPQAMMLDQVGRKAAIDELLNKVALVMETMKATMRDGEHFGKIPGCGDKPALLKAGAEKLGMVFRLKARFDVSERDLGHNHREYFVKCILSDGSEGVGSCSTMEGKYRYRGGERKCPECGKATIIKGKAEYGGGWLCFAKKGGCGAKFAEDDKSITDQQVGKVEHDNPADFYNTCLKMGKKRAHVDAIITSTACSDIFTQDIEEAIERADNRTAAPATATTPEKAVAPETAPKEAPKSKAKTEANELFMPVVTVKLVHEKSGTRPSDGRKWVRYLILLNDGVADLEAGTFSKTVAGMANTLANNGRPCEVKLVRSKVDPQAWDIESLLPKDDAGQGQDDLPMGDENNEPIGTTP